MKKLLPLFLLLFTLPLFATTLIKHSLYEKPDRVDLMLTFDKPYEGKISKSENIDSIILLLDKIYFPKKEFSKELHSPIIQEITIVPYEDKTLIEIKGKNKFAVNASKTVDKMGLRIRITPKLSLAQSKETRHVSSTTSTNSSAKIPVQTQSYDFTAAFVKMIAVMILLLGGLWLFKRWMENKNSKNQSWLFPNKEEASQTIHVLEQQSLDLKNKIVHLQFQNRRYLVLLGESALLLDKFSDQKQTNEEETQKSERDENPENREEEDRFQELLQSSSKRLGDYLAK